MKNPFEEFEGHKRTGGNVNTPDPREIFRMLGKKMILVPIAFFVLVVFLFNTIRVERIGGDEVGVLLSRLTGKMTTVGTGTTIYNGLTNELYILDRTLQTLEMTANVSRGERQGKDDLKVKTIDGSDVNIDITVQYRIDPSMASTVLTTSGPGDAFKAVWARDYVRSICRNYLGELTTEDFYDTSKRNVQVLAAKAEANEKLNPYGIVIDSLVIPTKPEFYAEYEAMIKKKKLADQAVLEEQSKAEAAKQKQQTLMVQETNKKNVAVEEFKGEMEQKLIAARAEGEKVRKQAEAYHERVTIGAEATLYKLEKESDAILASKRAEAKGIEAMKKALEGEGGRNMVKMEYARKLKDITITGKPFSIQGTVERFEHSQGPAASTGRTAPSGEKQ